jgi:DNA-binding SARP family transcriptional activator
LATMFWSEYDQSKARANLRRELSRIKAVLGEETLEIQREKVGLRESDRWWLDVKAFQANLNAAQELLLKQSDTIGEQDISNLISEIRDAVAQYSGEFMAGFSLPDSTQFDEWQFFQRDTLNRSLSDALQRLVYWETARNAYEEAIQYARRLLTIDNLYESTHRQLMQFYAWSGQQGSAIRQYEQIVHLLEKEIGVKPEEETLALYEAIKSRQLAPLIMKHCCWLHPG